MRTPITMLAQQLIELSGLDETHATRFVQHVYGAGADDQHRRDLAEIKALQQEVALLREEISRLQSAASI